MEVTILIPNYNGMKFLPDCMRALEAQTFKEFKTLVVDNASTDGSIEWLKNNNINTIFSDKNLGFAGGVNLGLRSVDTKFVILLNNDTKVFNNYVEELLKAIKKSEKIFSVSPMMIQMLNPSLLDDAGDELCLLGWAYQRGVGENIKYYEKPKEVFSSCAGAAIYRTDILNELGLFDDMHFAYLEDIDVGYKARLHSYKNIYEPKAKVYHFGSGTSGSKYNSFKVKLAARNNIYLHYKNQSNIQLIINFLPLLSGILIKSIFFARKGFLKDYIDGNLEAFRTLRKCKRQDFSKIPFRNLIKIELALFMNTLYYIKHFINRRLKKF